MCLHAVNFSRHQRRLYVHDRHRYTARHFALACACNGRYYGGGFNPVPDAMPDDGFLDFLIVKGVSRLKFLKVIGKYAKGRYKELTDIISYIRGKNMKIQGETEMAVNIDGELIRAKDVVFRLVPLGVRFLFPEYLRFFDLREQSSSASGSIPEI
jgi:diacylglycerol kinase family enzyme